MNEVASLVAQAASQLAPVPSPDPLPDSDTDEPVVAVSKDDDPDDAAMHARLSEARAALSNAAEALSAASGEKLSSMSQLGMSALQKHAVDRTAAEVSGRQLDSDHNFKVVELVIVEFDFIMPCCLGLIFFISMYGAGFVGGSHGCGLPCTILYGR